MKKTIIGVLLMFSVGWLCQHFIKMAITSISDSFNKSNEQAEEIHFSNFLWGDSKLEVLKKLEASDYKYNQRLSEIKVGEGEQIAFNGEIAGSDAMGIFCFEKDKLIKTFIRFYNEDYSGYSWDESLALYKILSETLEKKYGTSKVYEKFYESYKLGDGREIEALANEKAAWARAWPEKAMLRNLMLQIIVIDEETATVHIKYESTKAKEDPSEKTKKSLDDL